MARQYIDYHYRGDVERGTGNRGVSRQATVPCLSGRKLHPPEPAAKCVGGVNFGSFSVIM